MMYISHINECISNDIIYSYIYIYIYIYMISCVLTNDFMWSASPDPVHPLVGLGARQTLMGRIFLVEKSGVSNGLGGEMRLEARVGPGFGIF